MSTRMKTRKPEERLAQTFRRMYRGKHWVRMRGHGPSRWVSYGDLRAVMPNNLHVPAGVLTRRFDETYVCIAAVRGWVDHQDPKAGLELERFIHWVEEQART